MSLKFPIAFADEPPPQWMLDKGVTYVRIPNPEGVPTPDWYRAYSSAFHYFVRMQNKVGLLMDALPDVFPLPDV